MTLTAPKNRIVACEIPIPISDVVWVHEDWSRQRIHWSILSSGVEGIEPGDQVITRAMSGHQLTDDWWAIHKDDVLCKVEGDPENLYVRDLVQDPEHGD